jgi:hypothetical protein
MTIENFKTTDIVLAAVLKVNGYELKSITKEGNKGTFYFNNVSKDLLQKYDFGNMMVEPVAFNSAIKTLTTAVKRVS